MNSRRLRHALGALLFLAVACGQTPETTEKARGVLSGANVVVALTIVFIVVAGGIIFGAVALDRFVRSRRELAAAPPAPTEEEEEQDEVVAGIRVGRAGVPRWLYAFYVLIPLFAMLYVINSVSLRPPQAAERPAATEQPTGPRTEWTIVSRQIKFDLDTLILPADTEVTVTYDNQDAGIPHTFTVWGSKEAADANQDSGKIADTGQFTGVAEKTVTFDSGDAGAYYFNCIVHPTSMFGTVEVVPA